MCTVINEAKKTQKQCGCPIICIPDIQEHNFVVFHDNF